jgi:hypothetical protein
MKWSVLLIALLFLLPVTAQDQGRNDGGKETGQSADNSNSNQSRAESRPDDRPNQRADDRSPGRVLQAGQVHDGEFVSISYINGTFAYKFANVTWFELDLTDARVYSREHQWVVESDEGKLTISDNPTGHVSYKGTNVEVMFAGNHSERGQGTIIEQDGKIGFLSIENRKSFFSFHIKVGDEKREAVEAAIESRRVAAKITKDEIESYDDVEITVNRPTKATRDTPFRVEIGAELAEGRTIVLDVDRTTLQGPDLELRYFDLNYDGTETEVVFRQAESLEDILEPTDDAGQPEYWIVEDENGLQVMVSIPYWSTHAVTLASLGTFVQPQVWLGIAVGAVVTVFAAALIMRPKREE